LFELQVWNSLYLIGLYRYNYSHNVCAVMDFPCIGVSECECDDCMCMHVTR
jgi:hypothetical protein